MRKLFTIFLILISFIAQSQTNHTTINVKIESWGMTTPALLHLPAWYADSTARKFPLIVFGHGAGEAGTNLASIYNSSNSGGPAYFLEHAGWTETITNPAGGTDQFIIVSPQFNNSWAGSGDNYNEVIKYMVDNYRVDTNRINVVGLSAGGGGLYQLISHSNTTETAFTNSRFYKTRAAALVTMASNFPTQPIANVVVADSTRFWGFGDEVNDSHGVKAYDLYTFMNNTKPGIAKFIGNADGYTGGHCCFNTYMNPSYRSTKWGTNMNIYEWMLWVGGPSVGSAPASPTANAGSDQTITLPTSSVNLTGSGTAGTGTITGYSWAKISGPGTQSMPNPNNANVTVSGLVEGTFVFRLTVTNSGSQTATDDITITVNAAPVVGAPNAYAGIDQAVTIPMNFAILYGGFPYSKKGGSTAISSFVWSQISGPNTAVMSRRRESVVSINSTDSVVFISNLAVGTYQFKLTVTDAGGSDSDTMQVVVNARPAFNNSTKSVTITDGSYHPNDAGSYYNLNPGDTVYLDGALLDPLDEIIWGNLNGTAAQPILIKPKNALVNIKRLDFSNSGWGSGGEIRSSYIIIDGRGISGQTYGIKSKLFVLFSMHHVELRNCQSIGSPQTAIHLGGYENYSDDKRKFPAMNRVGYFIHDNFVDSSNQEGIYGGPTSLTNQGWDTVHYHPRGDSLFVYNNIMQNTGRDAIQVGGFGYTQIFNNSTFNNGMEGTGGQGSAINLGTLSTGSVTGNYMRKSWRNASFINGYGEILFKGNWVDSCAWYETSGGNALFYINSSYHNPEQTADRHVRLDSNFIRNPYNTLYTALSASSGVNTQPSNLDSNFILRANGGTDFYYFDDAGTTTVGNVSVVSIAWPTWPLSNTTGPTLLQTNITPPAVEPRKGRYVRYKIKH